MGTLLTLREGPTVEITVEGPVGFPSDGKKMEPPRHTTVIPRATAQSLRIARSGEAILFPSCSFLTRGLVARIGPVAVGAIALVTACAPAPPPVPATGQEPPAVALVSAPSAAMVTSAMVTSADTRLGELIENTPGSVVAGERLNIELLRRFYARHGFAPVWTNRQWQAGSLMNSVLRAGHPGLPP